MTAINPRSASEIYEALKANLQDKIPKLTNFIESSFNFVFVNAYASSQHDAEVAVTAAQLSGWVDYVGKTITDDDLDDLGIDGATADEINAFIEEGDLDEFAKVFGVSRDTPVAATGTVTFTTNTGITIQAGTRVGTQPDADGNFVAFETTETVSIQSPGFVDADITAQEPGVDGNTGSGTITYLPAPPTGVDSVTNIEATSGGADEQSTEELRDEVKQAVVSSVEGGTTQGVETYIRNNTTATAVTVEEKFQGDAAHGSYPHADVIVFGGTDQEVNDAIDESHPSGVEHILIRPTTVEFNVEIEAEGTNINTQVVEDNVLEYLEGLNLGQDVYADKIVQIAMNADPDIENLESVQITIVNEPHTFNGDIVDDFEDNDTDVLDDDWSGWNGDTGNLSAQNNVVIDGSLTGRLASSDEVATVTATRSSPVAHNGLEFAIRFDTETGNDNDFARVALFDGATRLGYVVFDGGGDIYWYDGTDVSLGTWSSGSTRRVKFDIDYDSSPNTARINVGGSTTTVDLENDASGIDVIQITNDTTASSSTVNTYIDTIQLYDHVYALDKALEPVDGPSDTGIEEITGVFRNTSTTFVENTDYREYNSVAGDTSEPQDSVDWSIFGDVPDPGTDFSVDYVVDEDIEIDSAEAAQINTVTVSLV